MHRGVYAVGHRNLSENARFIAAVAAIGAETALSHVSAAALWGLMQSTGDVHVTTTRSIKPRPGIRLHITRSLPPPDVTRHHGIPVTTPARTVLDVAQGLSERKLRRLVHEGEVQRLVSNDDLREQLHRSPGRRGSPRLLAIVYEGPVRTRSEFEEVTYDLLRRNGFPRPRTNTPLRGSRHGSKSTSTSRARRSSSKPTASSSTALAGGAAPTRASRRCSRRPASASSASPGSR